MWNRLKNSKAAWAAVGIVMVSLGGAIGGEIGWKEAIAASAFGLSQLFMRDGIAKVQK